VFLSLNKRLFSADEILSLLRSHKHDSLNHMQVISGLLQLGKTDRALQYIRKMTCEMERVGKFMMLKNPELVVSLLIKQKKAQKDNINYRFAAHTTLQNLNIPGEMFTSFCESLLNKVESIIKRTAEEKEVCLSFGENDRQYYLTLSVKPCSEEMAAELKCCTNRVLQGLGSYGCCVDETGLKDLLKIIVYFPKEK